MKRDLTLYESRVIGVLLEKEVTTPDQYPLSLNALVNGCNQKSNRSPVLSLDEPVVKQTVDTLIKKGLVKENSHGGRVAKYHHWFCNTNFGELKLNPQDLAVVCELLLRGPQTPGELRTRAARMAPLDTAEDVERALQRLIEHADGPLIAQLPRESGRREARYAHCFSVDIEPLPRSAESSNEISADKARVQELELKVSELENELSQLRDRLRQLGEAV